MSAVHQVPHSLGQQWHAHKRKMGKPTASQRLHLTLKNSNVVGSFTLSLMHACVAVLPRIENAALSAGKYPYKDMACAQV